MAAKNVRFTKLEQFCKALFHRMKAYSVEQIIELRKKIVQRF